MADLFHLDDRATFRISGSEATDFLQNLITCDVEGLADGALTFGALLTPQGKILFDFFVQKEADEYLFDVTASERPALMKRLMFYKLRADVVLTVDDCKVCWVANKNGNDPRLPALGDRIYKHADDIETTTAYDHNRILQGVPESGKDFPLGEFYPHDVYMDLFPTGGVDFSKGCYVGQEVVSRMKHKDGVRKRPMLLSGSNFPAAGTEVLVGGRAVGVMGSSNKDGAIGIMRIDRVAKAQAEGMPLLADDTEITATAPAHESWKV